LSKFVGRFHKDKNYNDDYNYDYKRHRNEHSEIKKLLSRDYENQISIEDYLDENESLPNYIKNR
jgi:hypothetical protein